MQPACTISSVEKNPSTSRKRTFLDKRVLVSNIVSGALWLMIPAITSPLLWLIGAAYVAVASMFLAAVYSRDKLSRRQEALAWTTPWLCAVAVWAWLIQFGESYSTWSLEPLWVAMTIATPLYVAWQLSALAVRQVLAWKARQGPDLTDDT